MKEAMIVYGGWEGHEPKPVAQVFEGILREEGFTISVFDTLDAFSNVEDLKNYDLIVPVWTMGELKNEYAENVAEAVASGVGLAGCHGGMCDAFRNSTTWQFLTGSQWVAHPGNDGVTYQVDIKKSSDSSIIQNINDFSVTSEQYYLHVDPAVSVLATTRFPVVSGPHSSNGCVTMPVVYTKRWGEGKVYYNSLGHHASIFEIPQAKELMRNGFIWAAR